MQNSILIATLVGPVLVAMGLGMLVGARGYVALAEEFIESRALVYLSGVLAMLGGIAIVNAHNLWVADWPVIITVLGWLASIGGAVRIVFPDRVRGIGRRLLRRPALMPVSAAIVILLGAILTYMGLTA